MVLKDKGASCLQLTLKWFRKKIIYTYVYIHIHIYIYNKANVVKYLNRKSEQNVFESSMHYS